VSTRSITVMLVYEPATSHQGPVPLARIDNPKLALLVARSAISEVEARAARLSDADEFLGEVERAEANRLRLVLTALIPELGFPEAPPDSPVM
jgi:hypothetical protein